jgi:hypothetical protein
MGDAENLKTCFVIAPIGSKGSDVRARSDRVYEYIIKEVVLGLGYGEPVRADKIPDPGMITDQIIGHLLDDDLVIADLSGRNANVFYELAIRHAIRRPVVIMISDGDDIPFDVSQSRAIQFDYRDLASADHCKKELAEQIRSLEKNPDSVFSPISNAIDLRAMRESGDPSAQRDAHILSSLQALQANLSRLERRVDMYSATQHRANTAAVDAVGGLEQIPPIEEARNRALAIKMLADWLRKGDDEPKPDRDTETNNDE